MKKVKETIIGGGTGGSGIAREGWCGIGAGSGGISFATKEWL